MEYAQILLDGRTRMDVAIERIKAFEPPEGYYLAFSGGKDSTVIYHLAVMANVKFDAHYAQVGIDPPELVQHIKRYYPDVERHTQHPSIWQLVEKKGLPRRQARWCCELLKENGGSGRIVITGLRWAESHRRRQRRMFEVCRKEAAKRYLHPIIDWNNAEVWAFIHDHQLPYCSLYDEGFTRLGCVMCPMQGPRQVAIERQRWPKLSEAWRRAAIRYWERQTDGGKKFPDGDSFFRWWLIRRKVTRADQCVMF